MIRVAVVREISQRALESKVGYASGGSAVMVDQRRILAGIKAISSTLDLLQSRRCNNIFM